MGKHRRHVAVTFMVPVTCGVTAGRREHYRGQSSRNNAFVLMIHRIFQDGFDASAVRYRAAADAEKGTPRKGSNVPARTLFRKGQRSAAEKMAGTYCEQKLMEYAVKKQAGNRMTRVREQA